MTGPEHPGDFSARRGCVRTPFLVIVLAALIAAIVLIAQHRFPLRTSPSVPSKTAPAPAPPRSQGEAGAVGLALSVPNPAHRGLNAVPLEGDWLAPHAKVQPENPLARTHREATTHYFIEIKSDKRPGCNKRIFGRDIIIIITYNNLHNTAVYTS